MRRRLIVNNKVILKKKGYKAYLILNKPEKLNALDMDMYLDLLHYMKELEKDSNIRVIIIKGNGRGFSAGYDIKAETDISISPLEERDSFRDSSNALRWLIWDINKPVICQVHGYCLGGACELTLPADFVIASEDAVIGEPEIKFGSPPVFLMIPWLTGIRKGKELLMTGENISGNDAEKFGLITKAVPLEKIDEEVESLANKLIRIPPEILYLQKLGINRQFEMMGMKTGIDTWLDMSMYFRFFRTEEIETFSRITAEQGVKAALKWRDDFFSEVKAEK